MQSKEHSFLLRFSVRAAIPDALLDDDDFEEDAYLAEWERALKPAVLRAVFQALRAAPDWSSHVRNRGIASEDEIEVVLERTYPTM
jgi:hypothetical protein